MPDYPIGAAPIPTRSVSFTLIDAGAKTASVPMPDLSVDPTDLTTVLIENARSAIGNLSNAGVFKTNRESTEEIPTAFIQPFDEAHSSVVNRLNLTFQNILGVEWLVSVPAPDLSYFTAGGGAMIRPDITAAIGTPARILANSVAAIIAYLNIAMASDPSFRLTNAYETTRSAGTRGRPSSGRVIYAEEPEAGEFPAGAPDNLPAVGQQP